jgi:hypothetical protein
MTDTKGKMEIKIFYRIDYHHNYDCYHRTNGSIRHFLDLRMIEEKFNILFRFCESGIREHLPLLAISASLGFTC